VTSFLRPGVAAEQGFLGQKKNPTTRGVGLKILSRER